MALTIKELTEICQKHLGNSLMNKSGRVLYSGESTLKKGDFYFLGFNPGGAASDKDLIKDSIALPGHCNAFLNQKWCNEISSYDVGQAPLQKRVDYLLKNLGANTTEVCATNLIFLRSPKASELADSAELAKRCWPVHEELLRIVSPKVILCHGRAAFDFLKPRCGASSIEEFGAEWGSWKCRSATLAAGGLLLGVPHLSRFDPTGRDKVLKYLRKRVEGAGITPPPKTD